MTFSWKHFEAKYLYRLSHNTSLEKFLAKPVKDYNLKYEFRERYASICHLCYDILKDKELTENIYSALGITTIP
jgi:hypothetical protein